MFINDTSEYYRKVKDPRERMDDEITISHLLRSPNSFTGNGLPFGSILARNLMERGLVREGMRVLEVGPGLGDLADGFSREANPKEYVFVDISPGIMDFLKTRFTGKTYRFVLADFLQMKTNEKYDLIICNEVLSDFPTIVNFFLESVGEGEGIYGDAFRMVKEYGLDVKDTTNFNYGAIKFLEVSNRILREGGVIFVCEQDCDRDGTGQPERIRVFGHNEYTVKMTWLGKVARGLGFTVETGSLTEFLGVRKKKFVSFFTRSELRNFYELLKRKGIRPDQRAYTVDEFLRENGKFIPTGDLGKYKEFLRRNAGFLSDVTDKFSYMILKK